MPKKTKFIPRKAGPKRWILNVPAAFTATGKRERWQFRTKDLALAAAEPLKERQAEHGEAWKSAPPLLVAEATQAKEILAPWGISLVQAARDAAEAARAAAASSTLAAAWAAFTAAKANKAAVTLKEYRQTQAAMVSTFGENKPLARITGQELVDMVAATTKGRGAYHNARVRTTKAFWAWCARPPREWCKPEVAAVLEKAELPQEETKVLTPAQAKALFTAAEAYKPALVPWLALSIFAGLRQSEIARMKPGDISAEGVQVSAGNKTGRRHIAMPPPLAAWLAEYPVGDSVLPADFREQYDELRRRAGWRVRVQGMEKPKATLPAWPQNILRHTAASVALGLGKPIDTLIFEHGHAGGVGTLKKHYLGIMPRTVAQEIWCIGPHGKTLPLLSEVPTAPGVAV